MKIPLGEPIFSSEESGVWQQFFLELQHLGERGHIHLYDEVMANKMKLRFFNGSFVGKPFFEGGMILFFCCYGNLAFISTTISFSIDFLKKNGSPLFVTCVGLKYPFPFSQDLEREKFCR